jgi:hypothetical protein
LERLVDHAALSDRDPRCARDPAGHTSWSGPSPSDDVFRSGDERKRSPEVGGLADLPRSDSQVRVRPDFRIRRFVC